MIAVLRSPGATVANRALQLVVQGPTGVLTDVSSAAFQIISLARPENEATPLQVYPAVLDDRQTINVTTQRIGLGRYAAVWTPASDADLGRYLVRWYYEVADGPEQSFDQEFELVTRAYNGPAYCTLYDLAAAGMAAAEADDGTVQRLIVDSSRYIELYTGRQFYPFYKSVTLSGRRGRMLLLEEPIIAIESLAIDYTGTFAADRVRELGSYRVFNRHLTQNLFSPDDRENPKLEFLEGWGEDHYGVDEGFYVDRFTGGTQNIRVNGIFGYTEPDASFVGSTPHLIRHACKLICLRSTNLNAASRANTQQAWRDGRVKSEYTRDQGYILFDPKDLPAPPGAGTTHTSDPEIDSILHSFRRGPRFGAA